MEIIILDGAKRRMTEITSLLEKNKYKVVQCLTSNDFMSALGKSTVGLYMIDVDTWHHGRAVYSYFQAGKKIENVPVVFYNAPQNFATITDRPRHDKDYILQKPSENDAILEAVSHTM